MRDYIGSADAAAMLGMSPWKSPLQLYLELRGEIESEDKTSDEIQFGITFEDAVIDEFLRRKRWTDLTIVVRQEHFRHPRYPYLGATLDAYRVLYVEIIEAKTATIYSADEWTDGPPRHILVQCHWQMMVTGFRKVYVPVYFDSRRFEIFEVERDEEICKELLEAGKAFWAQVQAGEPPTVTSRDTGTLARWFPCATIASVDLDSKLRPTVERIRDLGDIIKSYEDEKEYLINTVKRELGEGEIGLVDGEKLVSWKEQTREGIDTALLKDQEPEIYDKYMKVSRFRVFRLHGGKK